MLGFQEGWGSRGLISLLSFHIRCVCKSLLRQNLMNSSHWTITFISFLVSQVMSKHMLILNEITLSLESFHNSKMIYVGKLWHIFKYQNDDQWFKNFQSKLRIIEMSKLMMSLITSQNIRAWKWYLRSCSKVFSLYRWIHQDPETNLVLLLVCYLFVII